MLRGCGPLARSVRGCEIGGRFLRGRVTLRRIGVERDIGYPVPIAGGKPQQEEESEAAH